MAPAVVPPPRKRLYRQSPGERWWFGLLLLPTSLTAAVVYLAGPSIESRLADQAKSQLTAAGLSRTVVEMHGRSATVKVPTGESEKDAATIVGKVEGIGKVTVVHVAASAAEAKACEGLQGKLDAVTKGRGVAFGGSSATLSSASAAQVRAVAKLLVRCPSANVSVKGYTDATVIKSSTVSLQRAQEVRAALMRGGVVTARIRIQGFGDSFPVSAVNSPAGRALNNRVEIDLAED